MVFGKQAEFCSNYLGKGRLVLVEGSIQTRKWQDQKGQDRYTTEVKARSVQALEPNSQQKSANEGWIKDLDEDYYPKKSDKPSSEQEPAKLNVGDDPFGDVPF